jgi:3D (Asp-Asp-Asp) domain-containing protein
MIAMKKLRIDKSDRKSGRTSDRKALKKSSIAVIGALVSAVALFTIPIESIAESDVVLIEPAPATQQTAPEAGSLQAIEKAAAPAHKAKAKADGRSHITINWPAVEAAEGYTVYRSTDPDKLGDRLYTTKKASTRSYKDEGAAVDGEYWYTVRAWKKADGKKEALANIKAGKVTNTLKYESAFRVKTYAYSGGGTTASGKKAQEGLVAVDPNLIELGTWLYVEDYGLCQAADTGGSIKGKKIDLYMENTSDCYEWGVRHKQVYVLE